MSDALRKAMEEESKLISKITEKYIEESDDYLLKRIPGGTAAKKKARQDMVFRCQACGEPRTINAANTWSFIGHCYTCEDDIHFKFYKNLNDIPEWDREHYTGAPF